MMYVSSQPRINVGSKLRMENSEAMTSTFVDLSNSVCKPWDLRTLKNGGRWLRWEWGVGGGGEWGLQSNAANFTSLSAMIQ